MSDGKPLYKTRIELIIYSEQPIPDELTMSLTDIGYEIEDGEWVGNVVVGPSHDIARLDAAVELAAIGSDIAFFGEE